ncbi:ABC transporter permease [Thorsellia anophelis]|uniref:Peptide/nickel transport system permease protein n=1 Tax=Thorsellia anophelis DSM 18579 TaxID=1123402 RepID=A0A1I0AVX5_9GAMM|nr:ABC transporter permease [Thorsellia anophelis]SES97720.1 peptide/nickel transport system permease protein [Thorsellia anophelis DSM 18579]
MNFTIKLSTALYTIILASLVMIAIFAPWVAPFDPLEQNPANRLLSPNNTYWFGTDGFGRDILSRIIFGLRPTLLLLLSVGSITLFIGILIGMISGQTNSWLSHVLMRFTDIVMGLPRLLIAFAFVAILGNGILNVIIALSITSWPQYARLAHTLINNIAQSDFILASKMAGITRVRILRYHLLPLCLPQLLVKLSLDLAGILIASAGLSYLGLGVKPPSVDWGGMVAENAEFLTSHWWVTLMPSLAIVMTSLLCILIGETLRDRLDSRHMSNS